MKKKFYDLVAEDIKGSEVKMNAYTGNVLLIVNTASYCGFTPQFEGLEKLYNKYKEKGLVIMGFPCNQFGNQDPEKNETIEKYCQLKYGVTFPMFSKIDVNGKNEHPIYKFLKLKKWGLLGKRINWNFTKFLLDKNGNVVKRFESVVKPEIIEKRIVQLLEEKS